MFKCTICDYTCEKEGTLQKHKAGHPHSFKSKHAVDRSISDQKYYEKLKAMKEKHSYDELDIIDMKQTETCKKQKLISAATLLLNETTHTSLSARDSYLNSDEFTVDTLNNITDAAIEVLKNTMSYSLESSNNTNNENQHVIEKISPNICVFCDRYIIGISDVHWIHKDKILKHSHRINIDRWKSISGNTEINSILRKQYLVDETGFEDLLLSPRSMKKTDDTFMSCVTCYHSFRDDYIHSAPPKYSFSNNFLIGQLPNNAWKNENDTCEMNILLPLMIAPIRPFSYLFSVHGGACKRMKGTVSLFSNNQSQMHGAFDAVRSRLNNLVFFLVFLGRLTNEQKLLARNKIKVNTDQYIRLLKWMIENNSKQFYDIDINNPSIPIVMDRNDDTSTNLHDESVDKNTETKFDFQFYFPSNDTPTETAAGFENSSTFLRAVISGNTPTMYLFGNNFVSDVNLKLESVFPIAFPFGVGGPDTHRENKVSYEECLRHYRDLCLSAMHKEDIILMSYHLVNRILSYKLAILKCSTKISMNVSLAEQFSNITAKQLEEAYVQRVEPRINPDISTASAPTSISSRFFKTIEACCKPLQHTAEASTAARGKYFAMTDLMSMGAIFFTLSPTANRNLRVRAFAYGKCVTVPQPWKVLLQTVRLGIIRQI